MLSRGLKSSSNTNMFYLWLFGNFSGPICKPLPWLSLFLLYGSNHISHTSMQLCLVDRIAHHPDVLHFPCFFVIILRSFSLVYSRAAFYHWYLSQIFLYCSRLDDEAHGTVSPTMNIGRMNSALVKLCIDKSLILHQSQI